MTAQWKTREVKVGKVGVGGSNPIRIQSMTTSNTRDIEATIDQIIRLQEAGCEIARMTVQGMKEADACEGIKNGLLRRGFDIPLVADIHFYPPAAFRAADFVEKVRINPGNFVDKRASFKTIEYDDASYAEEIEKIEEKFTPLVEKCKRLKRSLRIGTNHGSLSDRIMNRYGDTPQGMVESALEFAKICRKNDYHDIIFSMKSSNPQVMILAYRLLVKEMQALGWDYPLHLGVTEAGAGEDGRIKSAIGIGSLLLDGIGDTIRVSLTEDPWNEIDPCRKLIALANRANKSYRLPEGFEKIERREVIYPKRVGLHKKGSVIVSLSENDLEDPALFTNLGCTVEEGEPKVAISSADSIAINFSPGHPQLSILQRSGIGLFVKGPQKVGVSLLTLSDALVPKMVDRYSLRLQEREPIAVIIRDETPDEWEALLTIKPALLFLGPTQDRIPFSRRFFQWLKEKNWNLPVILHFAYNGSKEETIIEAAAECGALLIDGLGEGLFIEAPFEIDFIKTLSFNILQAARMRTFKTDFISCPSCGRTLFDLQEVSRRIRDRTSHLPGVKIAIMGCIVNGPGEMADADFGYVGSKPGMIDLYVGKKCVEKDIPFSEADDRLVNLLQQEGRWIDPDTSAIDF